MGTVLRLNRVSYLLLKKGIYPWSTGIEARLPDHYKHRYVEQWEKKPIPVHIKFEPEYYRDEETGVVKRRQLEDITTIWCREQDEGLWGGEGIVKGFVQPREKCRRVPKIWRPQLARRIYYSEILNRYMVFIVTHRTMDLIDQALGFDNYILQTHQVDLKSALGMKLKRDMLLTLRDKSMYPTDLKRRDEVYEKHKNFDILPREEIEWLGLSLKEACKKQKELEMEAARQAIRPLKEIYVEDLIARIKGVEAGSEISSSGKKNGLLSRIFGASKEKSRP